MTYTHTGPPTPAPKKKRTLLIVLAVIGGLLGLCCIGGALIVYLGGKMAPATTAQEVAMGTPTRDGKFEFTVQKVECGQKQAGDLFGKTAQGQFCMVTLQVKNIGDQPQTLSDSDQKAFDAAGAQYSTDSEAGMYINKDTSQVWFTEINPGNQVTGIIVFDIPEAATLVRLELHDSPFSGGVKVKVS